MHSPQPTNSLSDMLAAIEKIQRYTAGMTKEDWVANDLVWDAVIRNLEVMSEAGNRLGDYFWHQHPSIPFYKLKGLRNRLVHQYDHIDDLIVWNVIQEHLPQLRLQLIDLLSKFTPPSAS